MPNKYEGKLRSPEYTHHLKEIDEKYRGIGLGIKRKPAGAILDNGKFMVYFKPTALALFDLLIFYSPEVVSRQVIIDQLELFSDANLRMAIVDLRKTISRIIPEISSKKIIRTIERTGYCFQLDEP